MLKRLYIDNYKCFVNFTLCPGPLHLLMGGNGSGKTTLGMLLTSLRDVIAGDPLAPDLPKQPHFGLSTFNKWQQKPTQTVELETEVEGHTYLYVLQVEHKDHFKSGESQRPRVLSERLEMDGKLLLEFFEGRLTVGTNAGAGINFRLDWHRSALSFLQPRPENRNIFGFKTWVENIGYFRLVPPFSSSAEQEMARPDRNLSNFTAWLRYKLQENPAIYYGVEQTLREVLPGFRRLAFQTLDDGRKTQIADFEAQGQTRGFPLDTLSDGQQALIGLYFLLHGLVGVDERLVIFDEPDNFVALREIQPWLNQLQDRLAESKGQVMLISHHPELLNQLAPDCGLVFRRLDSGYAQAEPYQPLEPKDLTPAELEVRGW